MLRPARSSATAKVVVEAVLHEGSQINHDRQAECTGSLMLQPGQPILQNAEASCVHAAHVWGLPA